MKNFISHVRFRMVLPLLFLGVLLTLPTASTGSKYVWNDTIRESLNKSSAAGKLIFFAIHAE